MLSFPYGIVQRRFSRRRQRALEQEMKSAGRLITSSDFIHEMELGHGTLIVERHSFKGPVEAWWTPDNTYQLCPLPAVDWLTMLKDDGFRPLSEWYRQRYISAKTGRALLVAADQDATTFWKKLYTTGLDSGTWVEIAPVEKFEDIQRGAGRG